MFVVRPLMCVCVAICVVATFLPELDRGFSLPVAFPVFVPYQLQAIDLQP